MLRPEYCQHVERSPPKAISISFCCATHVTVRYEAMAHRRFTGKDGDWGGVTEVTLLPAPTRLHGC